MNDQLPEGRAREAVRNLIPAKWRSRKADRVRDFPGMVSVCLFHAGRWRDEADPAWRHGGSANCICETVADARLRLKAEIAWARQDEELARLRAEELEAQLAKARHD